MGIDHGPRGLRRRPYGEPAPSTTWLGAMCSVRSTNRSIAPIRNPTAPTNVPRLDRDAVADLPGPRHDVAGHRRDPEGHGPEQIDEGDPPVHLPGAPRAPTVTHLPPREQAGDKEADGPHRIGTPHELVGRLGREVDPARVPGAAIEEERPRELDRRGEPFDPARLEHEEATAAAAGRDREGIHRFSILQKCSCGEEDRAHEERVRRDRRPERPRVRRERAEREEHRAEGEEDADPPASGPRRPPRRAGRRP